MKKSIISCGKYIPANHISRDEYINAWGKCASEIREKPVMDIDEDVLTMAVEAAQDALDGLDKRRVGVFAAASTGFPYEEKTAAGTIAEALGINQSVLTSQHSGSALAGMEALFSGAGLLDYAGEDYALVVISDSPRSSVSGDLDHGLGAGACAFVLQRGGAGLDIENVYSTVKETMGIRYRQAGMNEIEDIGVRSYSSEDYNTMVSSSVKGLLEKEGSSPAGYHELVLPQVNIRENKALVKRLGFKEEQVENSRLFAQTGDTGACASLLPLCRVLEYAAGGSKILLCAYGAGSGSCSAGLYLNNRINTGTPMESLPVHKQYISYVQYLKLKQVI